MRIKFSYLTPLLAAGAAAAAIAAAPTAMAASACTNGVCPNTHSSLPSGELPGNSQVNNPSGGIAYSPQYPYAEGDYGGYFGGGWGHGGGGFGGGGFGGGGHGK
jgi:hypothetical protein